MAHCVTNKFNFCPNCKETIRWYPGDAQNIKKNKQFNFSSDKRICGQKVPKCMHLGYISMCIEIFIDFEVPCAPLYKKTDKQKN